MNGPRGYYAKWTKLNSERKVPYHLTYMWNLKDKTNKTKWKETHRYREQMGDFQKEGGGKGWGKLGTGD